MDNQTVHPIIQPPGAVVVSEGSSLRDMFAAAADVTPYAGLIGEWQALNGAVTVDAMATCIARIRYAEADAMLAARQPQTPSEPLPEITEPAS